VKRRTEYLVEKRDGRREWLRASKLARSIHAALRAGREGEAWRAVELAQVVLAGVARARATAQTPVKTSELAHAVERVLLAQRCVHSAVAYLQVGAERQRRRDQLRAAPATDAPRPEAGRVQGDVLAGRLPFAR
jgi:hypothetical protein